MRAGLPLGRIAGIPVFMHWSFGIVVAWSAYYGYRIGGREMVTFSVLVTLLAFVCVFLHELGHALAGRSFGIRTRSITMLPIGGVALLERMPERPLHEIVVAIAGPMVNVIILAAMYLVFGYPDIEVLAGFPWTWRHLVVMVFYINVVMIVFNLIPAFPMDGGRVLRALLAIRLPFDRATAVAAAIGKGMAVLIAAAGVGGNPFLVLIGLFVFVGARTEDRMATARARLAGLKVADLITARTGIFLGEGQRLAECGAISLSTGQRDFIVLADGGRIAGMLPHRRWLAFLEDGDEDRSCADTMIKPSVILDAGMPASGLLPLLSRTGQEVYPVVEQGAAVGILTRERILHLIHDVQAVNRITGRPVAARRPSTFIDVG